MTDSADEAAQQRRKALLNELRVLVASLHRDEASHQSASTKSALPQLITRWALAWTAPVTCALTVLAAFAWNTTAAYAFATAEIAGALVLRARHLRHHWWRRWLYGVALAVLLIAAS